MLTAVISREGPLWVWRLDTGASGVTDTVEASIRAINAESVAGPGQYTSITFDWADEFVRDATKIQSRRARLHHEEQKLDFDTRRAVVSLSDRGLSVRDIGALLGISPGRVSQLRSPGHTFGEEEDRDAPIQLVDLFTEKGVVTRFGRGDLPEEIVFEGVAYKRTGGAHGAGGGPMKHSYVPSG